MNYRLELISDDEFENLINTICQEILGTGVVVFSKGKDGGRDGRFEGTANNYPSNSENWTGKFIIQAKHTTNPIASCSDSSFETVIKEEIERLKKLKKAGEIENYLLFTNRKYTGVKGEALRKRIKTEIGLNNVNVIGIETINNQYLSGNKDIVRQYGLDKLILPFDFSEEEIRDVIVEFKKQLEEIGDEIKQKVEKVKYDYNGIKIQDKNAKNKLGKIYFEQEVVGKSLEHFDKIDRFLQNPKNSDFKEGYYDCVNELSQVVLINRDDFGAFEEVLLYVYKLVCDGSSTLKGSKRFVSVFLHYMYYTCSIGLK
ncbi:MAG: ABC-three component system protein [Bacteroidota bacterium]